MHHKLLEDGRCSAILIHLNAPVAQWLEQGTHNALVLGSNPGGSTYFQVRVPDST